MAYKKRDNPRKGKADIHELKQRIKNDILIKHQNRSTIIQYLINDGYTHSTAESYYAEIVREIKSDFKDRQEFLRELHIQMHEENYHTADEIENIKDRLHIKTKILERMEKITGLEETTIKHEGQININISPDFLPDRVIKKIES
jgi:hypothetical protein